MTDREKVINGLEFIKEMITFDPSTGEDIDPEYLNEADKTSYDSCVGAITLLKKQESLAQKMWNAFYKAEDKHDNEYAGSDHNDDWYGVWRSWMQQGFGIALDVVVEELG